MARRSKADREERRKRRQLKEVVKEKEKRLADPFVAGREDHFDCLICERPIKPGQAFRKILPDAKSQEWRFYHYPDCGPGTEAWFKFHPSRTAQLMLLGKEVKAEKRLKRRIRKLTRLGKPIPQLTMKGETTMSKKAGKKGEHLKPMEPVVIPDSIIKKQSKEVQALLKELNGLKERSSPDGTRIRKALRKLNFRLSDYRENGGGKKKEAPPKKRKKDKASEEEEE